MDVLGPVGWLEELLHLEAEGTLKFGWKTLNRRQRDTRWELGCYDIDVGWHISSITIGTWS